jgi:hypothetical protein
MKCGTTALWHYLRQHSGIYLPRKNIDFFNDEQWPKGQSWYQSFFPENEISGRIVGEISTEYAKFPQHCGAPARIAELMPDVRLVYIVRHPVRRMISHYIHNVSNLSETRAPEVALTPGEGNAYLDYSLYHMQIEQYLPFFPREQILLLRNEDLRERPGETLDRVFDYIGASRLSRVNPLVVHSRAEKRAWNALGAYIRRSPRRFDLFRYYQSRMPAKLAELALWATGHPVKVGSLPQSLLTGIAARLNPDLGKLYEFAGHEFKPWDLDDI